MHLLYRFSGIWSVVRVELKYTLIRSKQGHILVEKYDTDVNLLMGIKKTKPLLTFLIKKKAKHYLNVNTKNRNTEK